MATNPTYSPVIMGKLEEINKRIENADNYFRTCPEALSKGTIVAAYNELRIRQKYLMKAKMFLEYVQRNETNTCDAADNCKQFYSYSVSPFMYDSMEEMAAYSKRVEARLEMYKSSWDRRLAFRARKVNETKDGRSRIDYLYALKSYVELVVDMFLWLRQQEFKISDPKPQEQTDNKA